EARAGVIRLAAQFAEIDADAGAIAALREPLDDLLERIEPRPHRGRAERLARAVEDLGATIERDEGEQGAAICLGDLSRDERRLEGGRVLAREGLDDAGASRFWDHVERGTTELDLRELDVEALEPRGFESADRQLDDLDVRVGTREADAL